MITSDSIYNYTLKREKIGGIADSVLTANPKDVVEFLHKLRLHEEEQECLIAVVLDVRNNIRGYYNVTRGLVDQAMAHAREVFRYAIINNASRVIMVHNHPSGDPSPSMRDIHLTEEIKKSGIIIGIELTDHIIIGGDAYFSFLEEGMMKNKSHIVGKEK